MRAADWLVDMGPGAGEHGGEVVAEGTPDEVMRTQRLGHRRVPLRRRDDRRARAARRTTDGCVPRPRRARAQPEGHRRRVPARRSSSASPASPARASPRSSTRSSTRRSRTASTRCGSKPGDHDAVEGIECFDKVIDIDQSPIGRTPRSNPATYTDLFTHVRELFALTPEAKVRGYKPGPLLVQRARRPLRGVQGRRADQDRDALPARRLRAVRDVPRASATTARRSRCASRASRSPTCSRCRSRRRSSSSRRSRRSAGGCRRCTTSGSTTSGSASRRRRSRAARRSA